MVNIYIMNTHWLRLNKTQTQQIHPPPKKKYGNNQLNKSLSERKLIVEAFLE